MKNNIFKNKEHEAAYDRDSYVVLDLLTQEDIDHLTEVYHQIHSKDNEGFYATTFLTDLEYRRKVDEAVSNVFGPRLDNYFFDYKNYLGSYVTKSSKRNSDLGLHQDLTLLDETDYEPINVWVPLIDINKKNGALRILKGSHRFPALLRAPSIPFPYQKHRRLINRHMTTKYVKAGQAVVFSQRALHDSVPNVSGSTRVVAQTFIAHKDSRFQIAFREKSTPEMIDVYKTDHNFLRKFQQFYDGVYDTPHLGEKVKQVPYDGWQPSRKEMKEMIKEHCQ